MDQLFNGRQMLYERLESSIKEQRDPSEMENIINALNIRTGSFGVERKNLVNGLFKTIIEVSFPNFVKYLFWGVSENRGIFDSLMAAPFSQVVQKQIPPTVAVGAGAGGGGAGGVGEELLSQMNISINGNEQKAKKLSKYQLEELRNREGLK